MPEKVGLQVGLSVTRGWVMSQPTRWPVDARAKRLCRILGKAKATRDLSLHLRSNQTKPSEEWKDKRLDDSTTPTSQPQLGHFLRIHPRLAIIRRKTSGRLSETSPDWWNYPRTPARAFFFRCDKWLWSQLPDTFLLTLQTSFLMLSQQSGGRENPPLANIPTINLLSAGLCRRFDVIN